MGVIEMEGGYGRRGRWMCSKRAVGSQGEMGEDEGKWPRSKRAVVEVEGRWVMSKRKVVEADWMLPKRSGYDRGDRCVGVREGE